MIFLKYEWESKSHTPNLQRFFLTIFAKCFYIRYEKVNFLFISEFRKTPIITCSVAGTVFKAVAS